MNKPNRCLYILILCISLLITATVFCIHNDNWAAIMAGIGCGGVTSAAAAFKKERKKTNEKDTCYFCAGGRAAG